MSWQHCKNILCIRPDNMGDLIMSAPAIRALKESFGAKITILTSSMAKPVANHIAEIDEVIIFDLPWVKSKKKQDTNSFNEVAAFLKERNFDAAVIFTVFSQSPLPSALVAYLAGIPRVLAYCRENPYHLLTDWVPDPEPYDYIRHQVRRDLDLVATVGATASDERLRLNVNEDLWTQVAEKLSAIGFDTGRPWLIIHPGVSEKKREYPLEAWVEAAKIMANNIGCQLLITGSDYEKHLADELQLQIGHGTFSAAGLFSLGEFICLVKHAPLMLSVNTGTIHIAAAVGTPVVVLYAQTNPQHTPWMVPGKVIEFPVPKPLQSKNQVIAYLNRSFYNIPAKWPSAIDIVNAVNDVINRQGLPVQPFHEIQNGNRVTAAS